MKISIAQCQPGPEDVAGNIRNIDKVASDAASIGADILICPEMVVSGYCIGAEAASRLAEPDNGAYSKAISKIAQKNKIAIVFGYPERDDQNNIYNSAMFINREGKTLLNYRKTNLFGDLDRSMFSPSHGKMDIVEFDGWRIGVLICYDIEFPENARLLALEGAELIIVPTACMTPYDSVPMTLVPARAIENQVYLAYANYTGSEPGIKYCGLSCIISPDGVDLARAKSEGTNELIAANLTHSELSRVREDITYHADRRPELYQPLSKIG